MSRPVLRAGLELAVAVFAAGVVGVFAAQGAVRNCRARAREVGELLDRSPFVVPAALAIGLGGIVLPAIVGFLSGEEP